MLNKYFERPLFWDYTISLIFVCIAFLLKRFAHLRITNNDIILSIASDLSTVGLTAAGFILTLLTVLITFKTNSKITKENANQSNSLFELFSASNLFFETISHLKNCVKSLIVISVLGYIVKLIIYEHQFLFLYFYNIIALTIIVLTLWRSLVILTNILKMQKEN